MKYVQQWGIILFISFVGEFISDLLPLPVPGSIYGMIILFVLLLTGILKVHQVRDTAMWLIAVMPIMFVPPGVGLLKSFGILKPVIFQVLFITIFSTVAVMVVAGKVTDLIIRIKGEEQ